MERYAIDHEGYVAPYAETQLTFEEFNEMFDFQLKNYHKLRKEFDCEKAFPHVYEKISKLGRNWCRTFSPLYLIYSHINLAQIKKIFQKSVRDYLVVIWHDDHFQGQR